MVVTRVFFKYDAQGRVSEQVEKTPAGLLRRRFVFTRDALGRVGIQAYDAQGNVLKDESRVIVPSQQNIPSQPKSRRTR